MSGANEVQDALYVATDGCQDAERVRDRIMVFIGELPEDMTVQEILASEAIGSEAEGEDDGA